MSQRRFVLLFSMIACLLWTAPLAAQDSTTSDEIENAKYQFTGLVNSNAVYVRSGPSENDYPTMKLDKDAEVTAVGLRYEWLKIVPPEGSFCYVAKAFVDRRANGSVGRVTSTLNVRVGSQLNELKAKIATKLEPGADVEIVGEEQEYFKIKPPADVYFYVNRQFVEPVRRADATEPDQQPTQAPPTEQPKPIELAQSDQPQDPAVPDAGPMATSTNDSSAIPPTEPAVTDAAPPTTQPQASNADAEFERLEAAYAEVTLKPLAEQQIDDLLTSYQQLAAGNGLPESLRRIAEFKSEVLKGRLEAKQQLSDTQKLIGDMKEKQMALGAERQELEQRIKEADIEFYTAVGTLRPSSLQQGEEILYRLTDPSNGRTVVYIRSGDGKLAAMIGQFIGVKGEVQTDQQLNIRIITPTAAAAVNPAKVGQSVAAQIVPPSLLPGGGTAQTE